MRSEAGRTLAEVQVLSAGLSIAAEIGAALAGTSDVQSLLIVLQRQLKWLVPAPHVSLSIRHSDGQSYRTHNSHGAGDPRSIEIGLVGWALQHNVMLDLPDLSDTASLPPCKGRCGDIPEEGALLVLPLRADRQLLALLTIGSPRVHQYDGVDRGVINLIALQVAAALRALLLLEELDGAEAIVAGMARAVEAKDVYTRGHADRVTTYALALADAALLPIAVHDIIAHAGPLHDVGKIGVPDHVLGKPGPLNAEERALMERHPVIGDEICSPLRSLRRLRPSIRHHHERYDGHGYPDGLAGEAIPIEARVLAVADAFDAMTSNRPYRNGMPVDRALSIMARNEGPQWDPAVVAVFCALHRVNEAALL